MSFFTTLHFYRPRKPPRVTGESLAEFMLAFNALGVSNVPLPVQLRLKFGKAIDKDDKPSSWLEHLGMGIHETNEIKWDLNAKCASLLEVADALGRHKKAIYRAYIELGAANDQITGAIQRINSPENKHDLTLGDWTCEIGPIQSFDLRSDEPLHVGWISVSLSGYGYLYSWSFADLVERVEADPGMRQVAELCRKSWPVPVELPDDGIRELRQKK